MNEGANVLVDRGSNLPNESERPVLVQCRTILGGREREKASKESPREERKSREEENRRKRKERERKKERKRRKKNNVSMILAGAFPGRQDVITEIGGE